MSDTRSVQNHNAHTQAVYTLAAAMVRWGMFLAIPAALITLITAAVLTGRDGLMSSGFGAVLGFGSALITIASMRLAANRPPEALMRIALGGYALKMSALLVVMLALTNVSTVHRPALGFGLLVVVIVWAVADVVAFQRTKIPTIILSDSVTNSSSSSREQ